jgi:alkylation response protein AidB-like acyl-CoA dehydrogenase
MTSAPILDDDIQQLRSVVAQQAAVRIAPLASRVDREQRFSPELWAAVRDVGLFALPFAEEYGGAGGSVQAYVAATEEVGRHCAVAGLYPGTTIQVAMTLLAHGTPEQISTHVPALVAGERLAAWAFTEPGTGSDPRQITTRAERIDGGWRLSGQKLLISFADQAAQALVFARTDERALGAFLVDTDQRGWSVGTPADVLSFGGTEAAPVHLDGVELSDDRLVGGPQDGFSVMLAGEAFGKVRASAICVGIGRRAVEEAARYASSREHRGEPIGEKFATVRAQIGAAAAGVAGAAALVRECASILDTGGDVTGQAASARLVSARAAREAALAALHVCGAYGLTKDLPVERLYREAVFFDVAQGVAEIQQLIVAREVLAQVNRLESRQGVQQ